MSSSSLPALAFDFLALAAVSELLAAAPYELAAKLSVAK